jgi:ABC-2 type transport system permease protein
VSVSDATLQDIRGPSALGGGGRRFLHLVWVIASTDFKLTYFGSVLGYLWSLMRPLLLFGVLYVVFSEVVRLGDGVENYPVLLLLNIVLFSFFQEATQNAVTSAVVRENLVRKMHFPRMVIPLSTVLTAAFNMTVNMAAVFVFVLAYGVDPRASWLLFPLIVLAFIVFTAGVAMLLSALYPRYRDVQPIWAVLSTILFYGSPVLYPIELVPEDWRTLVLANPLAALLEGARVAVVDASAPSIAEATGSDLAWLLPTFVFVAVCTLGFWVFNREAPRIAEEL